MDERKLAHFNILLSQLLKHIEHSMIFAFSENETRFIKDILPHYLAQQLPDKSFTHLTKLWIIL